MSAPHLVWVRAMRAKAYAAAWDLTAQAMAARRPEARDDPALPYHLRWVWDGRPFDGRDVLVRCYHGLGDTLQFVRFLPALRARAASVVLEVQPRLIPLLTGRGLADRLHPFDPARPLPPAACDLEIMELPQALRVRPDGAVPPYLSVQPAPLPLGTLGLCCQSGEWDSARSLTPELLAPLCAEAPCITLDVAPSPLAVLNPAGCPLDLMQTAALVAGCALVVTVDTMIAHLAGALGRPVWLLLCHEPDWRWTPGAPDSPWYPTMRLFHQPEPGDWAGAVGALYADLGKFIAKERQDHGYGNRVPAHPGVVGRTARQDHHPRDQAGAHR
ncbi:MAG: glycosyltransferase family 9 protein [Pseudomonadota bacterium]